MVGAYMFNIVASELMGVAMVAAVVVLTWPEPPWSLLLYVSGAMMLSLPFLFYPFSKTLFLAFDLCFRPLEETEEEP